MMRVAASLLALASVADASTRVAVVELGVGGAVRRTSSTSSRTTMEGANSFFQAMHGTRKLQHAGMTVVPDLFRKADAGVVVGLSGSGVSTAAMPSVAAMLESEGNGVVGHLEMSGAQSSALVSRCKVSEEIASGLHESVEKAVEKESFAGVKMMVDTTMADAVDKDVSALVREMDQKFKKEGKTVVLYLVVEEDSSSVDHRRLNDQDAADEENANKLGDYYIFRKKKNGNNNNNGNDDQGDEEYYDDNPFAQMFPAYYGYGYYNSYGEWVTPYKSMFQIQYFNVVFWTAIGLAFVFASTIGLMLAMPLEPDTLLFGESAKMVGED